MSDYIAKAMIAVGTLGLIYGAVKMIINNKNA